ncbi:MAG: hypothetical protein AVDCRST_MAG26-116, partial [uncultured Chloroflexia bacterium]
RRLHAAARHRVTSNPPRRCNSSWTRRCNRRQRAERQRGSTRSRLI